jgi:uncharacterized protein (TIGR00251 family)
MSANRRHDSGTGPRFSAASAAPSGVGVLTPAGDGIRLRIVVQPRAVRTEIVGEHGGALKVRVAAPPVDGAANEALVKFLAEELGVPRSAVSVAAGASSRAKVVLVAGINPAQARAQLALLNSRRPGP